MMIKNIFMSLLLAVSCQKAEDGGDASLNVVGGTETKEYPGVLRFLVEKESGRFCTGVVVSDSTALLAGHCIKKSTVENQIYAERADQKGAVIISKKVYFWTSVAGLEMLNPETTARDLAVVAFPAGTFKGPFVKIAPAAVNGIRAKTRDAVILVGYGANELGSASGARDSLGVKRMGRNVIHTLENGYYKVRAILGDRSSTNNAIGASGDAGAPLFDSEGNLIGIGAGLLLTTKTADGSENMTALGKDDLGYPAHEVENATYAYNTFVDLSSEASRKLLTYAAWNGRADKAPVVIPGIHPTEDAKLTEEDQSWIVLNNKDRNGEWVALTGGGGIIAAKSSFALQASASCGNGQSQQVNNGSSFASCSTSGGGSSSASVGGGSMGGGPMGTSFNPFNMGGNPSQGVPPFPETFGFQPPQTTFSAPQPTQQFVWPSFPPNSGSGVSASATPGGFASASIPGTTVSTGQPTMSPFPGFGGPFYQQSPAFQDPAYAPDATGPFQQPPGGQDWIFQQFGSQGGFFN